MEGFLTVCWRASLDRLCQLIFTLGKQEKKLQVAISVFLLMELLLMYALVQSLSSTSSSGPCVCLPTGVTTKHLLKVDISSSLLIALLVSQTVSWVQKTNAVPIVFGKLDG